MFSKGVMGEGALRERPYMVKSDTKGFKTEICSYNPSFMIVMMPGLLGQDILALDF